MPVQVNLSRGICAGVMALAITTVTASAASDVSAAVLSLTFLISGGPASAILSDQATP
jgi:hypothetical protein